MADSSEAWTAVARSAAQLGRAVKERFDEAGGTGADTAKAALDALGDAVDRLGDTLRTVVGDDEVKARASEVARTFSDALTSTFQSVGDDVADAFKRRGRPAE